MRRSIERLNTHVQVPFDWANGLPTIRENHHLLAGEDVPGWVVLVLLSLGSVSIVSALWLLLLPEFHPAIGPTWTVSPQKAKDGISPASAHDVAPTKAVGAVAANSAEESDTRADAERLAANADHHIVELASVSFEPFAAQAEEKRSLLSAKTAGQSASVRAEPCPPVFTVTFERNSIIPAVAGWHHEAAYLLDWLSRHPQTKVRLEGHTDALGSEEYNLLLSYRRAKAVAAALADAGLPPDRLLISAFGEQSRPTGREAASVNSRRVAVLTEGSNECLGPLLRRSTPDLKDHVQAIAAGLRRTRDLALSSNRPTTYVVDPNARQFVTGEGKPSYQLPNAIDVTLYTARSELSLGNKGAIRFFPNGTSTGGRITLKTEKRHWLVDVDWLTGQIRVSDEAAQLP